MPTTLADLPPELLPELLAPLVSRRDLYNICLVSRDWREIGQRQLLRHVRLFGRDLAIAPLLFETLASSPRLAVLVRKLEIRVFPISLKVQEQAATERLAIAMLENCVNCEELVWTRKGALTDRVWVAIHRMPALRALELNAHTNLSPGSWSAGHLVNLRPIRALSLILPDRNVADILGEFFKRQRRLASKSSEGESESLPIEEFSVLCRESPVINNNVIRTITPHLEGSRITSLALAGCAKLTGDPLLELLPKLPHLRHLALEACNLAPTFYTQIAESIFQLQSLKLTHPGPRHPSLPAFFPSLARLLASLPRLSAFTLYHSGASSDGRRDWPTLPDGFIEDITATNGANMRKFEVSGILTSVDVVEILARGMPKLRNLVLHLGGDFDLDRLTSAFAPLSELRTVHLLSQRANVTPDAVLALAEQCSPTLRQVGFRNRVWIVKRTYTSASDERPKVGLGPYDLPWWPEALLVVRFVETAAAFGAFRRNKYGAESDVETEVEEASSASSREEASNSEDDD
ncbi:hypothetical protein JCM10908_001156 [Rhodotorula pacifica]|uniref:uncharacterized protein n=1 Tax=Rhodotorula pacifica TaxID=1495444 RepID=UPI00317A98E5